MTESSMSGTRATDAVFGQEQIDLVLQRSENEQEVYKALQNRKLLRAARERQNGSQQQPKDIEASLAELD